MAWDYGQLCTEIYDLDKPTGFSFGDIAYYQRALAGVQGRVLEPAVGTGRILIPLLEAGFRVEGYDLSPDMLALCRVRCRERGLEAVLQKADMTSFVEEVAFAAIIVPLGSIVLLDGPDETLRALQRFYQCLQPGGRLILDVPAPRLVQQPVALRHWRVGQVIWTLQTLGVEYDSAANQTTSWLRYDKWNDGVHVGSELQPFRLQHWSIQEFTDLLARVGFADITVTTGYEPDRAPGPGSEDWTFHAVRPGESAVR